MEKTHDKKSRLITKKNSFNEKIKRIVFGFEDYIYELVNGYEFSGFVHNTNLITEFDESLKHAYSYMPMWNRNLRVLLNEAYKTQTQFDNFIDIGSGKGKPCFYAGSKHTYENIIGVEFSQPLIDVAEKNKQRTKLKNITFINCDATKYKLPEKDNLVFLFNPFDEITLEKFILLNWTHFQSRNSVIAYLNDVHRMSLTKLGFETIFRDQNRKISLYQLPEPIAL